MGVFGFARIRMIQAQRAVGGGLLGASTGAAIGGIAGGGRGAATGRA